MTVVVTKFNLNFLFIQSDYVLEEPHWMSCVGICYIFIHKCSSLARKTQQGHFETGRAAGRFICALITVLTQMTAWTSSIKTESGPCLFKKQRQSKEDI